MWKAWRRCYPSQGIQVSLLIKSSVLPHSCRVIASHLNTFLSCHGKSSSSPQSRVINQVPHFSSTASAKGATSSRRDDLRYNQIRGRGQVSHPPAEQRTQGQLAPLGQGQPFLLKARKPLGSLYQGCSGAHLLVSPLPANQAKATHVFSTPSSCKALGLTPAKLLSKKRTVTVPALAYASEMSGPLDAALKGQLVARSCLRSKIKMHYL